MADAIEIFTNSASERIEVITSGAQGPQGPAGPAGATYDQDLNTTDAVTFASVNAPLYDPELNQSGIEVFNGSAFIRGANGDAELNTEDLTALRSFFFPDESGHVALVENTATAAQGALADTAVQPNTGPSFTGIDVVSDTPMVVVESNSSGKSTAIKDGRIEFSAVGNDYVHTLQHGTISAHATFTLPTSTGTLALTSQIPSTFAASAITSGTLDNARVNWAAPGAIGGTTAAAGTFTSLNVASSIVFGTTAGSTFYSVACNAAGLFARGDGFYPYFGFLNKPVFWAGDNDMPTVRGVLGFGITSSPTNPYGGSDLILYRDAAQTLAQRNGTNAQESRVYATYTSSTNYQRGTVKCIKQTLSALSGASATTTGTFIPDGAVVVGVTTRVGTAITGATSYSVGDGSDVDRWGGSIAVALNTTSDNRDWTAGTVECFTSGGNVTLTANGSNFTGGAVEICVFYLAGEAD